MENQTHNGDGLSSHALFGIWSPIETAPKSARSVIIHCTERHNTFIAENGSGKWRIFGGGVLNEEPSHWMPLPSWPNTQAQATQPAPQNDEN
jgi:hypothetical protein